MVIADFGFNLLSQNIIEVLYIRSCFILIVVFCTGFESKFDWVDYLKETQSIAAPVELFNQVRCGLQEKNQQILTLIEKENKVVS